MEIMTAVAHGNTSFEYLFLSHSLLQSENGLYAVLIVGRHKKRALRIVIVHFVPPEF